jgi:hypothetical protein
VIGEESPLSGPFVPDDDFGVTYRSWEAFSDDNAERLRAFGPFDPSSDSRPTWAFFGNSFVQMPGALADTTRAAVGDRRVFNLGRNEHLPVRLAQIRFLLEQGLAPERVVMVLMPLDTGMLGWQPLETWQVTSSGAITFRPRLPDGPAAPLVAHSRLGLTAWVRAGRHRGHPWFHPRQLNEGIPEPLLRDLRYLFANLARSALRHHVPVTVILIPSHEQVMGRARCGFQDDLTPVLRGLGYDVLDPRQAFATHPDRPALFLPDKHFTPEGNRMLLGELLRHVRPRPWPRQRTGE